MYLEYLEKNKNCLGPESNRADPLMCIVCRVSYKRKRTTRAARLMVKRYHISVLHIIIYAQCTRYVLGDFCGTAHISTHMRCEEEINVSVEPQCRCRS